MGPAKALAENLDISRCAVFRGREGACLPVPRPGRRSHFLFLSGTVDWEGVPRYSGS